MTRSLIRLLIILAFGLLWAPLAAVAQPAANVARIGSLLSGELESPETRVLLDAFRQGLCEHW
jgi:hypothetical protein